ncbi:MAG: Spermidine/putrescine-binding periplasmic protein [Paracidovorax wautersii]|uniref:Spermidine/putrescine-binding periplasmic protein n=1 Tax=Paracidovorax wautersii TaxID=1177982 RepID=A0A7V8FSK8_9BURK|nr:MAG: Spermidine/putrescine-binding periplasmic protein [Paracidovorax wautersii]
MPSLHAPTLDRAPWATSSRRRFLQGSGAALGGALLGSPLSALAQSYSGDLLVSNWGGDWNTNLVAALEQPELESRGMRIVRDLAAAPARKTKILSERNLPRGSVDVAHFTDADAFELYQQGVLEELDYSKIPNAKHLLPSMGKPYYVPLYDSGVVIIYNKNKIKTPPKSFADLINPAYAGRVGLIDQIYFNYFFAFGLLGGGSMSNVEPAFDKLLALKKAVQPRIYPSHQQAAAALASEEIWITVNYNARAAQWKADGIPVEAAYPAEGAIAFEGSVCIPKRARNKDNAYQYLNAMLQPQVAQRLVETTYYAVPIDNAGFAPDVASAVSFTPEQRARLNRPDLAYAAKNQAAWLDWWNKEIKI